MSPPLLYGGLSFLVERILSCLARGVHTAVTFVAFLQRLYKYLSTSEICVILQVQEFEQYFQ